MIDQNWFAVFLDFFIVVVGILIAFQITNWNEAQQAKKRETAVLVQPEEEFTEIKTAIELQNKIRAGYVESFGKLIATLEGSGPAASDLEIRTALDAARSVGRRPAQSAAYLQLMASGELATLSNTNLQKALVRYDNRLQREAFIFPELMALVVEELTTNKYVDFDVTLLQQAGAAIDKDEGVDQTSELTRSYDLEGLKSFENHYETMYLMHGGLLNSDRTQLDLANEILDQIEKSQDR